MKSIFALVIGCFLLATTSASGLIVRGGGTPPLVPPACTITAVALSNNTFNTGSSGATVGTVSSTTTGTCLSPTYAIVSSGVDNASTTCSTTGNTDFALTGTALTATGAAGIAGPHINICVSLTIAAATTTSPFVQAFNIIGITIPCVITGVSLSNNTYNSLIPGATVGTVSTTTTGPCSAPTIAISSSGTDHSTTTCNSSGNTNFTITGGNTVTTVGSPGVNTWPNVCVQSTIAGATGSPFKQAFTITGLSSGVGIVVPGTSGSSASLVSNMQAINNTGSAQTNVPFSIGIPIDTGVLDASHHITASDSVNGLLTCDESNRSSDIGGRTGGISQVRMLTFSCNLPSWPIGVDNITLAVASGAPAVGTDIAISDITSVSSPPTTYDVIATILTMNGTTETASAKAGLLGHAGFLNLSTPAVLGKWRSGGGTVTDYILYVPYRDSSNVNDPNGLYALFDVSCYKAHTGAVNSSTNPILSCHTDLLNGNGIAELASPLPVNQYLSAYGISFTGSTCTNWAATAPTQTLTFSNISYPVTISIANPTVLNFSSAAVDVMASNQPFLLSTTGSLPSPLLVNTPYVSTGGNNINALTSYSGTAIDTTGSTQSGTHTIWPDTVGSVTASSALWTSDSIGTVITDGTFYGVITNIQSPTVADVTIWRPKVGLSTLTSGNYHLLPINHPYASRVHFTCDWLNTSTAAPLRVQNGNLYLGNAWNDTAKTGGPGPYFIASHAILNYHTAVDPGLAALDPNCPPNASGCNNLGNNPSAYGSPSGPWAGHSTCSGNFNGNFGSDQQASGGRGELLMHPAWNIQGLLKYDSLGYKWIFQNVDHLAVGPWNYISNASGSYPLSDVNTYSIKAGGAYTLLATNAGWTGTYVGYVNGCWYNISNAAHASNQFQIPYQLTGDWYLLVHHLNQMFSFAGIWGTGGNAGLENQWMGSHGGGNDERSMAWAFMHQGIAILLLPDNDTSNTSDAFKVLGGLNKVDAKTWLSKQWTSTGQGSKNWDCADAVNGYLACAGTIYSPGVYPTCPSGATCNTNFTNVTVPDARFLSESSQAGIGFMNGYFQNSFGQVYELGMCDMDCAQTYYWYMQVQSYLTDTVTIGSPIIVATGEGMMVTTSPTGDARGYPCRYFDPVDRPIWSCIYRKSYVTTDLSIIGAMTRYPSGVITLSGTLTPGNTITVTLPASNLISNGGTAFYTGGFLWTYDGGFCRIVSVTSVNTFTCTVTAPPSDSAHSPPYSTDGTFHSSSYANTNLVNPSPPPNFAGFPFLTAQWTIPSPHHGDAEGLEVAYLKTYGAAGAGGVHYVNMQQAGCAEATMNIGYPPPTSCDILNTYSDPDIMGFSSQADPLSMNIVIRP